MGRSWLRGLMAALFLGGPAQAAALPSSLVAAGLVGQADYGTIKGRLVWGGDQLPPARESVAKGKAAKDPEVCARDAPIAMKELVVDPATKGVQFGFAYLNKPAGANPEAVKELVAKHPSAELDQKGCEFLPYAMAIHQEQELVMKSSDAVNHNVRYASFNNGGLNQMLGPRGQLKLKLTAERRPIVVACDIHPWMKAYLMVFDHPFFAVTAADGSFEIRGVPAGTQNLVLWQEKVGYVNPEKARGTSVTVRAGETTDIGAVTISPSQVK